MAIDYERLGAGIVDHNLSLAEEPSPEARGGNTISGFMSECYLGQPSRSRVNPSFNEWHIHFSENNA
jgi:hypothetical protein